MPQMPPQPPRPPHQPQFRPPRRNNSLGYVLLFALILTVVYYVFNPQGATDDKKSTEIPISQMVAYYQDQRFSELEIKNSNVYATDKNNKSYYAVRPIGESLKDLGLSDPSNPTEVKAISTEAAA